MEFHNFDCDTEATALACIDSGSFPPPIASTHRKQDTYKECAESVRQGDVLVLSAWRGTGAEVFGVGLVTNTAARFQEHAVRWMQTRSHMLPKSGDSRGGQWVRQTAFTFEDSVAVGMGLEQLRALLMADEFTRTNRAAVQALMVSEGYTATRLAEMPTVCDILGRLMDDGFKVYPSGKSDHNGQVTEMGTILVQSGGVDVAYVPGGNYSKSQLIGLTFLKDGRPVQPVPVGFDEADMRAWAVDLGIDPTYLVLHPAGRRYIRVTDVEAAVQATHSVAARYNPHYEAPASAGRDATLEEDEQNLRRQYPSDPARLAQLLRARRGQGKYRADLLRLFDGRCAVSGLALPQALRASHVLAWRKCTTDEQRTDPNNGLLLSADLDALFDRHLISFDRDGKLMRSPKLDRHIDHHWPLGDLRHRPTDEQYAYLRLHNETFEQLVRSATR